MHQTATSLITELQPELIEPTPQIQMLSQLKNEILQKMEKIDALNDVYKQKSQLTFLNTFKKIMHQLSDQLKNAVQAYQNIDHQISQDQKCLFLSNQTKFFKNQRISMEEIYQNQLNKLHEVKNKNTQLKRKRNQLKRKSFLRQQKLSFYQTKNKSISLQFNESIQHDLNLKKHTESTKYPESAEKTRILTYSSQKKKHIFQNYETDNKIYHENRFYRTKNQNNNSQNSSRVKLKSFFL